MRRAEDQGLGVEVVLDGRPGRGELTIPLVNRSDETTRVERFSRGRSEVSGGRRRLDLTVRDDEPVELAPGASHDVTLTYRVAGCSDGQQLGSTGSLPAMDSATGEAIPLGVWLAVGRGSRC